MDFLVSTQPLVQLYKLCNLQNIFISALANKGKRSPAVRASSKKRFINVYESESKTHDSGSFLQSFCIPFTDSFPKSSPSSIETLSQNFLLLWWF